MLAGPKSLSRLLHSWGCNGSFCSLLDSYQTLVNMCTDEYAGARLVLCEAGYESSLPHPPAFRPIHRVVLLYAADSLTWLGVCLVSKLPQTSSAFLKLPLRSPCLDSLHPLITTSQIPAMTRTCAGCTEEAQKPFTPLFQELSGQLERLEEM